MPWITPKTNWIAADGVANTDLNRIEGNTLDLDTRVKTWETFKTNGGTIGGDLKAPTLSADYIRTMSTQVLDANTAKRRYAWNVESDGSRLAHTLHSYEATEAWKQVAARFYENGDMTIFGTFAANRISIGSFSTQNNGYTQRPNGFIEQWCVLYVGPTTESSTYLQRSATWPIVFPNGCLAASCVFTGTPTELANVDQLGLNGYSRWEGHATFYRTQGHLGINILFRAIGY